MAPASAVAFPVCPAETSWGSARLRPTLLPCFAAAVVAVAREELDDERYQIDR